MAAARIRSVLKWGLVALGLVCAGAAVFVINLVWFRPFNINHFYERVFIVEVLQDPELLTTLRVLEPLGFNGHNAELTDPSDAFLQGRIDRAKRNLAILRSYDRAKQTESQLLSTDILDWFMDDAVRAEPYLYHNYPVNQMDGIQSELPSFMDNDHSVASSEDAENYLARLGRFDWKFDRLVDALRNREEKGIVPPRFVIERVLNEMQDFAGTPATENMLYTSLAKKLDKLENLTADERQRFLGEAETRIDDAVYPAYRKLIAYFEELLPKATGDNGVWALPDGDAYYAWCLRSNTTSDLTPEEVHNVGLSEVARIETEMRSILDGLGHTGGTVSTWMTELAKDPRFLYPNTDAGREEALEKFRSIIDDAKPRLPALFGTIPAADVAVERIPVFKEKTAASYYMSPPLDGSRPGTFYAKLYDMNDAPIFGMRTLAYHETIPGHHLQGALQAELRGVPTFRKVLPFTAYIEGWALYAEYLARDEGFHPDPYSELGQLQSEMFRAVRLVVDTGIHYKRWTREQAIEYMMSKTGMAEGEVVSEIERYFVMPGQACAYKIGMLKILELREKAKAELGERFNIREFHDTVLLAGALPLEILERVVDDYIAAKQAER